MPKPPKTVVPVQLEEWDVRLERLKEAALNDVPPGDSMFRTTSRLASIVASIRQQFEAQNGLASKALDCENQFPGTHFQLCQSPNLPGEAYVELWAYSHGHSVQLAEKKMLIAESFSPGDLEKSVSPKCNNCLRVQVKLKRCRACAMVQYCNKECQHAHWKRHKKLCRNQTTRPVE